MIFRIALGVLVGLMSVDAFALYEGCVNTKRHKGKNLTSSEMNLCKSLLFKKGRPRLADIEHHTSNVISKASWLRMRQEMTPEFVSKLAQEELNQLYARLTAGDYPDGNHKIIQLMHAVGEKEDVYKEGFKAFVPNALFWVDNFVVKSVFQKIFDRQTMRVKSRGLPFMTATKGQFYCGQSLSDSRRESIVMDFTVRKKGDSRVFSNTMLRQEIRMVRPGFYLGRTYIRNVFLGNFVLFKVTRDFDPLADGEGEWVELPARVDFDKEQCWNGTQFVANRIDWTRI